MKKIRTLDGKKKTAYFGSRISENMKQTPEGFLICYNVPIARTGKQEYLGEEIGVTDEPDKLFAVIRTDEEVFAPATMASFEGKPVTNEHPDDDVVPDNYNYYSKGHATNIRRGEGKYSDTIVADLLICEKQAINDVLSGKREISCGYGCNYEFDDAGNIFQTNIRGNHIAIVDQGRAGPKVSIKDGMPEKQSERRFKPMAKGKKKQGIIAQILGMTANDVDPEALAAVIETVAELEAGDEEPTTDNDPAQDNDQTTDNETQDTGVTLDSETANKLVDSINALSDHIGALLKKEDLSPLDELEDELSEESVTKPVEEIDEDATDEEVEDSDAEDEGAEDSETEDDDTEDEDTTDSETVSNNDSLLKVIQAVKPHIAKIPNAKDRKNAADSLAKAIRAAKGKPTAKSNKNGYKNIVDAKAKTARTKARDKTNAVVNFDERQNVYDTLNPHKGGSAAAVQGGKK